MSLCDANEGPQDASCPSPTDVRNVFIKESQSICGHLFLYGGCPIFWKTHKESHISHSSCEAPRSRPLTNAYICPDVSAHPS